MQRNAGTYTTRVTADGVVTTAVNSDVAGRGIPLHAVLECPDVVVVEDQVVDDLRRGPVGGILGDVTTQTPRIVVQTGTILTLGNVKARKDGTEIDREAVVISGIQHWRAGK